MASAGRPAVGPQLMEAIYMSAFEPGRVAQIRQLNDALRITASGGRVVITAGVAALSDQEQQQVLDAVRGFADFNLGNDPYDEHDCACLSVGEHRIIWKIDCYDRQLSAHSTDPADTVVTVRVLTIMLAEDY